MEGLSITWMKRKRRRPASGDAPAQAGEECMRPLLLVHIVGVRHHQSGASQSAVSVTINHAFRCGGALAAALVTGSLSRRADICRPRAPPPISRPARRSPDQTFVSYSYHVFTRTPNTSAGAGTSPSPRRGWRPCPHARPSLQNPRAAAGRCCAARRGLVGSKLFPEVPIISKRILLFYSIK